MNRPDAPLLAGPCEGDGPGFFHFPRIPSMSRKLQETQTTVQCPRCHEGFRLSADDSVLFLREMQIGVECPVCVQQVTISVIPKAAGNHSRASLPANASGHSRGLAKPKGPSGQTKVGLPPFKPLGKEPAPAPATEATRSIPFAPIVTKKDKPPKNKSASENPADRQGWWGSQNQTTKLLFGLVGLLGIALTVLTVLLVRKPGPGTDANPKARTEILAGTPRQPAAESKQSGVLIPTEDASNPHTSKKARD